MNAIKVSEFYMDRDVLESMRNSKNILLFPIPDDIIYVDVNKTIKDIFLKKDKN